MATTFLMLAGEASGDSHAAKLITELKKLNADTRFVGMGGPKMAAAGLEVAKDLEGMQVVGFWEVARKYGFFKRVFYELLDRVKQEKPDALICVDYPGFNLRFAKEVKKLGIPVLYYIVPQVWAWKPMRAKSMAQFVDRAFCVFDFEPPFFEKFGLKTEFVGHPLIVVWGLGFGDCGLKLPPGPKTVALLPGSRASEYLAHYGPMMEGLVYSSTRLGELRALVSDLAGGPGTNGVSMILTPEGQTNLLRERRIEEAKRAIDRWLRRFLSHARYLPAAADFSVVKSGTSTLEAGLAGNPMCVVYKSSFISYAIAHLLVNIPVFSLVNIVLGRYAVPELLQGDVNPARIAQEIERGLTDEKYREQQKAALAELPKKLGGPGASARAAKGIVDFVRGRT
ncbi:MAG: lipid-A-disaccharide synthase [Planctomycetota bacterium]|nr:lipid-A-disaccharide synthase [Planctomycetota bacterium]